jgi:hypothetical protein
MGMVGGGKCPLEVKVTYLYVFFVCVGIFHSSTQRPKCVLDVAYERSTPKPSCPRLKICILSM